MNVSLRQIEVFLAVAQTLSFSEAAELCHLSQPALSANIKRLEEELGARLFDRHTRKVALTPVGAEFFATATALRDNAQIALARIQDFVAGRRGRLIVASVPSMASSFAPRVIAAFMREHPQIDVQLHDVLSEACIDMVRNGRADIALAPYKAGAEDLHQQQLFRDPVVVVYPVGHPLAQLSRVRWRDLQPHPHIVMNQSSGVRQLVDAEFSLFGLRMRPAFEVAQVGTMLGLIAANLGIGALAESLLQNANMGGLTYQRISDGNAYRVICAITPEGRALAPTVEPFLKLCQAFS